MAVALDTHDEENGIHPRDKQVHTIVNCYQQWYSTYNLKPAN